MSTTTIFNVASVIFLLLGATSIFYAFVKGSVYKQNHETDQNTIDTLKENLEARTIDRDRWKERALDAEGQNKVLQNTVTAAPAIASLTEQVARQHAASSKSQKQTTQLLGDLIKEFKKFVEAHDAGVTA